jgi:LCP family protein required for cell wall assembly
MQPNNKPDELRRFRSAAYQPSGERPAMDIRRPVARPVSTIGKTLPPQRLEQRRPADPVFKQPTFADARQSTPYRTPLVSKKRRRIITKKRIMVVLLLLILIGGGWMAVKVFSNAAKIFNGNIFNVLTTAKLKGEDVGRVNFLLAGNSADDPGHGGADLTDSIMIASVDTKDNTAFMLSIPRDTWVNIPGYGHAKINEAYVDGQNGNFSAPGYPSGGMGLLEEVVHENFGINFDYYALINYNGLRDAVNAVGGIEVNIQSSDPRGLYDPSVDYATHGPLVKLTNGEHLLNGEQALDLARARGDAYGSYGFEASDFERTQNQRMMVIALKSKILTAGVLANPIALSNLFDSLGQNVKTDLTLSEAHRLYDIGKNINNANIQSASLNQAGGKNLLANYAAPNGESALIPAAGVDNFSQIQAYITRLTSSSAAVREGASIVVLNGTSASGLAGQAQTMLTGKALNVVAVGDATVTPTTQIVDASSGKDPATLQLLRQLYGTNIVTTSPYTQDYAADFIVILGTDRAPATGSTQ